MSMVSASTVISGLEAQVVPAIGNR